ncbi:MAG: rhodanese-related sulfurtransferase [Ignavibacteria bacterium]|nr:rhodanese-related sulfurtransferase [Ignavibacteria bacterium]
MYRVLLFYKYVNIENPQFFAEEHLAYCQQLGLKGRIIISDEGINGTCSGSYRRTERYIMHMKSDKRFADMKFKTDEVKSHVFKKMHVRYKKELVTFRCKETINPNEISGKHLSPEQWLEMITRDDVVILDGRTDYEYDLGHFRNAVRPSVKSFREFPDWIEKEFMNNREKKILTYCTGGVRCEKLSGYLLKKGFREVYQLDGGIINYSKDPLTRGKFFEGKCYVFDERISIPVNFAEEHSVTGKCHHCGTSTDRYVNCANLDCHKQHFECEECEKKWLRSCSEDCMKAERHEILSSV